MPLTNTPFATGSEVAIAYVEETGFGQVPGSPAMQYLRVTGGPGMKTNKITGTSDEIRSDRNVVSEFQLGQDVTGSFPFEFSYGSFDDWLAAALFGSWTNNVLKNASIRRSFTILQNYLPGGQSIAEHIFAGCKIDGFTLSAAARQKFSGTWTLMGQREIDDPSTISGATFTASATSPVLTASGSVGALAFGSGGTAPVSSIDMTVTNHLYTRPEVGTLYSDEMGEGRFDVTGNVEVYFKDNTIYAQALAHQATSLSFTVGTGPSARYTFAAPNIQLGNMDLSLPGNDQDIKLKIPFRALLDPTSGATLTITRAV